MEADSSTSIGFHKITVTVAIIIAIWVTVQIWRHLYGLKHFARINLPYLKPVPFFGNIWPILSRKISSSELVVAMYNEFPQYKYFGAFEFGCPIYVLRDLELIKNVTVRNFDHFPDHKPLADESVDPLMGGNIFSMRGERWKEMRSIVNPVFTSSKMKGMFELIAKCAEDLVNHMTKQGKPVTLELKDAFTRYANDVIATTAFGISVNSFEKPENEFYRMGRETTSSKGLRTTKFLLTGWAPELSRLFNISLIPKKVTTFFYDLVEDTMETRKRENITRPDLIQLLMRAKYKRSNENLSLNDITSQSFVFFLAGFDTASTFMCFASHMLAVHPEIQERLIADIDEAFRKGNGAFTYETINELSYFDMILNETLRYYPPVGRLDRIVAREFELPPANESSKPILLRPGDRVWIPVHGLHHDPQYFPNPEKFDPERFGPENKNNFDAFAFLPFGSGPRRCPAKRFTLMEAKLVLSNILRKFRIKKCKKTLIPLVINKNTLGLTSQHGFWLTLEPRQDAI